MHGVDIGDLQRDVAPAACLTNRIDGRGAVFLEKKQAVSQAEGRTARPGLLREAENIAIESPVFPKASDAHGDAESRDAIKSRRHQLNTIAVGVDHSSRLLQTRSRDNQFAVTARCRLRQGLRMMVELDDGALLIEPVLFLPAADRQHMIEANSDFLLPEPQHWLQIVRRKSDVDDAFCQLHLPAVIRTMYPPVSRRHPIVWRPLPRLAPAA